MFICADTEDDSADLLKAGKSGFLKKVTQIAAICRDGTKFYNRGNVQEFLTWFKRRPEKFCYFHNLQYDLGNLFAERLDCLDMTLVGGRLIKAVWGNKTFIDSFNMWPAALWKIGEKFKLPKLGGKIIENKRTGEREFVSDTRCFANDRKYVLRDCSILKRAMGFAWRFAESEGIERLPATYGSLGVKLWKTWNGENTSDSSEIARAALFGGRVEIFKRRNESDKVCITDINSLYPFCMTKDFPGICTEQKELTTYGIAEVTVRVPKSGLCPLPVRNDEERIIYPYGTFRGTWAIAEIRNAEKFGATICEVHRVYGTNEASKPYSDFVNTLYHRRKISENEAEREFLKFLMNSFYGRLGLSGLTSKTVYQTEKNKKSGVPFGNKVLIEYLMPLPPEVNWVHNAYITSYGRIELLNYLRLVGTESLIYCDTDSCVFDATKGDIPFPIGKELGQMKLVSWEENCEVFVPKVYRIGQQFKAKGVPKKVAQEFIEKGTAAYDLPFKLRESIRYFDERRDKTGKVIRKALSKKLSVWRKVSKDRKGRYDRKTERNNKFFPKKYSNL